MRVELTLSGNVVKCKVSDNGSAPDPVRRGRGLTIVGALADSLGGRVHMSCAAEGYSFLLTFPLTESEQRTADAAHTVLSKRRGRRPQRLQTPKTGDLAASKRHKPSYGSVTNLDARRLPTSN